MWSERYRGEAEQRLAAYQELRTRIERLAVTARSADGCVAVTVRAGGAVSDLTLTEGALRLGADGLGRLVLGTLQQAHATLATRLARRAQAYVGDRHDVVGVVRGRLPEIQAPAGSGVAR
jgi:DNA-binding protein YbaB